MRGVDSKLLTLTLQSIAKDARDSLASLSLRLDPLTVAELSKVVDDAVDRFTASAAALDAAASSAERELADRRERFKNVIDATAAVTSRANTVWPPRSILVS